VDAGKDVFWYTREKQEEEAAKARLEMQAIKQREEDLMNEVDIQQQSLTVLTRLCVSYTKSFAGPGSQAENIEADGQAKVGLTRYG